MPQRSRQRRCARRAPLVLSTLAACVSALAGCGDNPSCVFAGGCQGGGGGALGPSAALPDHGDLILPASPKIDAVVPDGADASSTTPIALIFSESMAPSVVEGQVEVLALDIGGFPVAPVPTAQTLIGEGRMLAIFPLATLQPGDYVVRVADEGVLLDLTGQKVAADAGDELAAFQVDVEDPEEPVILATLPTGAEDDPRPTTTSIVVVFDRKVDPGSVTQASFDVQVDGAPPAFDPLPEPLIVPTSALPVTDTRVYTWRSVDLEGEPASLGLGAEVVVTLSPDAAPITDELGGAVPELVLEFTTQDLDPPLSARLLSMPTDAIGIANLTPGDPQELGIEVTLVGAEPGDEVLLTMFGDSKSEEPQLVALAREIELDGLPPITAVPITLDELDLIEDPGVAIFGDGAIAFSVALRRGNQVTPVRLLDVDEGPGIQDPLLDTVPPALVELLVPGASLTEMRSDVRDLVIAGLASEPLREASVVTPLGDNGPEKVVIGTLEDGLFLARPVPLGQIAGGGPVDFELLLLDPALNASSVALGVFTQHGAVEGGAAFVSGAPIAVEVVDADTLLPIAGARVYVHRDDGGGAAYPSIDSAVTGLDGAAEVLSADLGDATILTVDAPGYDLTSFHDLRATRISVVLRPSGVVSPAALGGAVTGVSDFAKLGLGILSKRLDDSRRFDELPGSFPGGSCAGSPPACPFGPEPIRPRELGATSFLAGNFALSEDQFSEASLIQAFELELPRPRTASGASDQVGVEVEFLLTEPTAPPGEAPVGTPGAMLDLAASGLLADLAGPPAFTVESAIPGLPAPVMVGLGIAYEDAPGLYDLRGAVPGAAASGGHFHDVGAVDPDWHLRVEVRDTLGNRSIARPRASSIPALPAPGVLEPPPPPAIVAPAGSTGGASFDVVFENALEDALGAPGIYVVTLADEVGRRWRLYRPDPPDAAGATTRVHLPDLAAVPGLPGTGLQDGALAASVRALAWPGFDAGEFLFTDLDRAHELLAETAETTLQQP